MLGGVKQAFNASKQERQNMVTNCHPPSYWEVPAVYV